MQWGSGDSKIGSDATHTIVMMDDALGDGALEGVDEDLHMASTGTKSTTLHAAGADMVTRGRETTRDRCYS